MANPDATTNPEGRTWQRRWLRDSDKRAAAAAATFAQLRDDLRWLNDFFDLGLENRHDPETWHGGNHDEIRRCRICRIARLLR